MSCFICDCPELIIDGERVPMPRRHSCEYVKQRNALIPRALEIANEQAPMVSASQDGGASLGNWTLGIRSSDGSAFKTTPQRRALKLDALLSACELNRPRNRLLALWRH